MSKHPNCPDRDSHGIHTITVNGQQVICEGYTVPQPRKGK